MGAFCYVKGEKMKELFYWLEVLTYCASIVICVYIIINF
ncbi:putative membrane protein [Escherichia coli 1-110-08_S4_C1]|nr:putative membrane protein [Escherichia coli 1-110-08_S4_C1]